ncbi:NAD(P)H-hydrate dehydratase [Aliiroseovarius sp. KMU-50]|uniref:Bifunctional NAD(P)H-hydrate repair enzyme n=1 Tax=Aliiroseovarius salicola TaxID=3009082 RepID=A0ABT4W3S5_9RHOB|nr:NAD(P)H-hydrate dehydratase [Aliiroseovarius sp. KMU-50]MDA5094383.1 NAD(P)H-hydrate dehydratase [Aliiroseovarius sp. KMU-50]
MTELLTAAQMRAIEQAAIDSGEVTGLELMERAGRGVVEAIFEEWPELASEPIESGQGGAAPDPSDPPRDISGQKKRRAVVLCGPGNNGGDGFVVARLLHERGWEAEVFLYGDAEKLPPDARVNYERWCEVGEVAVASFSTLPDARLTTIIVDALFGTGLSRPVELPASAMLSELDQLHPNEIAGKVVAIDIPSGVCSDSGKIIGDNVLWADLTVSFHSKKLSHVLSNCEEYCGKVRVVDIGLDSWNSLQWSQWFRRHIVESSSSSEQRVWALGGVSSSISYKSAPTYLVKARVFDLAKHNEHKYTHGHALILTGGFGKTGAARLAGRGALRIGAGLVTLGVPPSARMEVASTITAIMQIRVSEGQELATRLQDERLNALCLGPGLGVERARELVPVALLSQRATVLDADALTAFSDDPQVLFDQLHENCVLTPHGGEFARLFPDIAEKLNAPATKGPAYSKVDATREAAARAGCVVLFKGPDTVIAAPDGQCSINSAHYERSAPWLATAGSGDVLAGFITGLLARGFNAMQAAETAAWLHVECALEFGPGLIAEDLPDMLPKVFRKLEL